MGTRAADFRKLSQVGPLTRYVDTGLIVSTCNVCKRFFSMSGVTIGDLCRRMDTEHIEAQMSLHSNIELWVVVDGNIVL